MNSKNVSFFITDWLKSYVLKSNNKGFVIGVSGGIDSAVSSTLCAETGLDVLCLEMPIHQSEDHINRAREQIYFLKKNYPNVKSKTIDLTSVFEELKTKVSIDSTETDNEFALANTRSRLRMVTLYYHAGQLGYLVCGTGNKVEDFGVGFYTKYGDGGVDLSPIADLLKSEVYELGNCLNVPRSIIEASPSDGLFKDSRTDEDQIGASYPELEWAMSMKEKGKKADDFIGRENEVFKIFMRFFNSNQHKMETIPVCSISESIKSSL